jgi:hypothetical protein
MRVRALVVSFAALTLAACVDTSDPATFGTLKVQLQSAQKSSGNTDKVVVTLVKVTAHSQSAGWVTLSTDKQTVDLLNLAEGLPIGSAKLPAGKITQIRLYTAEGGPNYVQMKNGTRLELKVPSGVQSGIKVKGPFDLGTCQQTVASLQLDGNNSIHVHPTGQGDLWILRPVIKLGKTDTKDLECPSPTSDGPSTQGPDVDFNDGAGGACTTGQSCLSGSCNNGVCGQSGPGGACSTGADCTTGSCGADMTCSVGPGVGGAGSACTTDSQCASGYCMSGSCDQGGSGTPCQTTDDCGSGNLCESGSCTAQIL